MVLHMLLLAIMQESYDSYDSLPLEKTLTLHNVMILIESLVNKNQNHYYYNIFLERFLCQLAEKQ